MNTTVKIENDRQEKKKKIDSSPVALVFIEKSVPQRLKAEFLHSTTSANTTMVLPSKSWFQYSPTKKRLNTNSVNKSVIIASQTTSGVTPL